jgi:hypothetical protein
VPLCDSLAFCRVTIWLRCVQLLVLAHTRTHARTYGCTYTTQHATTPPLSCPPLIPPELGDLGGTIRRLLQLRAERYRHARVQFPREVATAHGTHVVAAPRLRRRRARAQQRQVTHPPFILHIVLSTSISFRRCHSINTCNHSYCCSSLRPPTPWKMAFHSSSRSVATTVLPISACVTFLLPCFSCSVFWPLYFR